MAKDNTLKIFSLEEVLESSGLNSALKNAGWVIRGIFYDESGNKITDGTADIGEAPAPIGDIYVRQNAEIKLVDVSTHAVIGTISLGGGGISWVKVEKLYTDFATTALTSTIDLFTLPIKGIYHNTFIKHSAQFLGGGITDYKLKVGIIGELNRFSFDFDVFQSVGNQIYGQYIYGALENFGAITDIKITATSKGANLDQASQGNVEIQYWISSLS